MSSEVSLSCWRRLRSGGHEASGLEIPTLDTKVSTGFGTIRWALGAAAEPRLLLPIRQIDPFEPEAISNAVSITVATYHLGGSPIRYLDLRCTVPALERVFGEVADEIMERVAAGESAIPACRTTIDDFRALLSASASEATPELVTGLMGELLVLRDLIRIHPRAWMLWQGPRGERHDFRGGNIALEVKASSRSGNRRVRISAIDQLEAPTDGRLVLALRIVESTYGGELTIGGLVQEILPLASEPMRIRELLAAMKCLDPFADAWNQRQFSLQAEHAYRVEGAFPRIVAGSLPDGALPSGISEVTYSLDLSAADSFLLGTGESDTYIKEMMACLT